MRLGLFINLRIDFYNLKLFSFVGNFYLDIETTGLDPDVDEILTIQYQES